jgi:ribonuclease-3 family protein
MEESVNSLKVIEKLRSDGGECKNPYQYSPLALAYIGDSVLDLMVKTHFVVNTNKQTSKYHKDVSNIVKAVNQARFIDRIADSLTEDELDIYKRGRNATTHSKAKNATMGEYRRATGLEALFGYLYLKGDVARLEEFVNDMVQDYEQTIQSK